nr:MAG: hypothetical protein DIU57_17525 [Pseudomonadota bacterium]
MAQPQLMEASTMCNRPLAALVLVALSCTPAVADEYLGQQHKSTIAADNLWKDPGGTGTLKKNKISL